MRSPEPCSLEPQSPHPDSHRGVVTLAGCLVRLTPGEQAVPCPGSEQSTKHPELQIRSRGNSRTTGVFCPLVGMAGDIFDVESTYQHKHEICGEYIYLLKVPMRFGAF